MKIGKMKRVLFHLSCFIVMSVQQIDLSGLVGNTIDLPCSVTTEKCGDLHSIKWYRGSSRIFVFSEMANIARSEGDYTDRAELQYTANSTVSSLRVKRLQVADEAVYKCEITYLEVREGCQVVQFINLTTLIKPEYVRLTRDDGTEVNNSSLIGPLVEGDEIILRCESGGGKPIPSVTWWNGTNPMQGTYNAQSGPNGIGTGVSTITVRVSRGDLGAKYECRAHNDALLSSPILSWVEIDVNVRPIKLALTGVEHHVVQGTKVLLQCIVSGARPAANITWFNGTEPLPPTSTDSSVQADGTYDTQSHLVFTASRFENDETLSCEASNSIMRERHEAPMRDTITLEVMYPPIVTVSPENVTVNESTDILLFCQYEANPATLQSVKWLRDEQELELNPDHYEGGTTDQTTLLIKNSTRHDHGVYRCELENSVGASPSTNSVFVNVHFKPIVNLTMEPSGPVSEIDRQNISLLCQVVAGNPDTLLSVVWFLDGEVLKELPDCRTPNSSFCDIDPSKLLLENVERSFHGNYSCVGMNDAGWGPVSPNTELVVYYPPGPTKLVYEPARVVKKGSVQLTCSVEDPGRPDNPTFRWVRDSHTLLGASTANYTIDPVTLETVANFTCTAVNDGGESESSTVHIQVHAPPTFIERLPPYYGALMNAQQISISCRVECLPLCSVNWLKNARAIDLGSNTRYTVHNTVVPPDTRTNDFASVHSTLIWNMSAWPGNQLDRIHDNANYTCQSTGNAVGVGVKSTTFFAVEYPPENVTVSNRAVNVIEGNVPEKVLCSAKAFPEASYQWRKEDESEIIIKGNALILNFPVSRTRDGNYVCEAFNRHGNNTQKTYINVLYKPECGITQTEKDGKIVLICTAKANPPEVDFTWRIKNENETIEENVEKKGLKSYLTLDTRVENFRTYLCFTNNSVGMSIPCERDVTGNIAWWRRLENDNLMIILAVIAGAILMVIIICVIIIIVCRRKRAADKYNNPVELEDRENSHGRFLMNLYDLHPEGNSAPPASSTTPKWPLRPGVLVHVNTSHSLSVSRLTQNSTSNNNQQRSLPHSHRRQQRRAISLANLSNESQHTRANRIRQMFTPEQRTKYRSDTLPGVFHGKSGVVTFKKLDGANSHQGASRKRKKPGSSPNPSATKDKSDLNSSPNDALLPPDADNNAFYENLPFHGMQNPPNKPVTVENINGAVPGPGSRPPSEMSQYGGSSGYGSTRSQLGPSLPTLDQSVMSDDRKFGSLRNCKRSRSDWPQFRSLRASKQSMLPIKENSPESKTSLIKEDNNNEERRDPSTPPTPAPRKLTSPNSRQPSVKHTYQNVPIPIIPNSSSNTECSESTKTKNPHCTLTNSQLDHQRLLLNSNGRQSLKKQKLQHSIRQNDGNDEFVYPSYRSNHHLPSPTPTYNGGAVVYADLALNHHRNHVPVPQNFPLYQPPRAHTEYAIIKFHDVGQEIDV
ncbi:neuromusculin isoform X3 [Lycorma delicatula]|uniref:neuromusculin isoform X3 n=1 Tax=Lycorma delicatula TaxID=130591 RepID=UPI003F514E82